MGNILTGNKYLKIYFIALLACSGVLAACDSADSAESAGPAKIVQSSIPPTKSGTKTPALKTAPLYAGDAVADDDGAVWWVSYDLPLAVNQKAQTLSPLIDQAPPSITEELARMALNDELPPMPPNLEIPYVFAHELMKAVYEQYGMVPEHPTILSWVIADETGHKGTMEMQEYGGFITRVEVLATMIKNLGQPVEEIERHNLPAVQCLFSGLDIFMENNEEVKEVMDRSFVPLLEAGEGVSKSIVKHGKRFTFTKLGHSDPDKIQFRLVVEPRG